MTTETIITEIKNYRRWTCALILLFSFNINVAAQDSTFCVFELFTSEGCSSCPYADDMLNVKALNAETSGDNHLYLACHIQYWDYLGWTDEYGMAIHDNMFFDYYNSGNGITFSSNSAFGTPLFVRNGDYGMNYSTALSEKTATSYIVLNYDGISGNTLSVDYTLSGDLSDSEVHFFLVERDLQNYVTSGENAGQTLHHENVVRDHIIEQSNNTSGTINFNIPADAWVSNMRVMAYIRKNTGSPWSRDITGATKGFRMDSYVTDDQIEKDDPGLTIYPNPGTNTLYISFNSPESISSVSVYNNLGEVVLQSDKLTLDISGLDKGMYYLKCHADPERSITRTFIKN